MRPRARCAYGGRFTTADGRLPAAFRAGSAGAVLVLGPAAIVVHTHLLAVLSVLTAFFLLNTVGNLGGRHPVERWGMSAVTLALTAAFVALALG